MRDAAWVAWSKNSAVLHDRAKSPRRSRRMFCSRSVKAPGKKAPWRFMPDPAGPSRRIWRWCPDAVMRRRPARSLRACGSREARLCWPGTPCLYSYMQWWQLQGFGRRLRPPALFHSSWPAREAAGPKRVRATQFSGCKHPAIRPTAPSPDGAQRAPVIPGAAQHHMVRPWSIATTAMDAPHFNKTPRSSDRVFCLPRFP